MFFRIAALMLSVCAIALPARPVDASSSDNGEAVTQG
jgi:hypothetical protein